MLHHGVQVGNFFLGEKQTGPEFTDEDEEILVLFAAQAASAVANARTHRAEQSTRADLEALVETSPVGVVVFDAQSGLPVSFNREARRIMEGLRTAGRPIEELMEIATCRFSDGSEIALSELPMPQVLASARTLRSEEVVTSVPDGRSITTLVNVTPIPSDDGAVKSVVITLQDLAPLQELERLRADFLGMVSHELRGPLAAIKGSAATLLADSDGMTRSWAACWSRTERPSGTSAGMKVRCAWPMRCMSGMLSLRLRLSCRAVVTSGPSGCRGVGTGREGTVPEFGGRLGEDSGGCSEGVTVITEGWYPKAS